MSLEVNFNYTGGRREEVPMNGNLSYNPATGANNPFTNVSLRPFPDWGIVNFEWLAGWSNYYGTDFTLTKRYSDNWQLSGSYTLAVLQGRSPAPRTVVHRRPTGSSISRPLGFALAPDMGGEYTYAVSDQRHRFTANGIWDVGRGLQVSGIYFFGSGERLQCEYGRRSARDEGRGGVSASSGCAPTARSSRATSSSAIRFTAWTCGSSSGFRSPAALRVDGMFEVFNLFNHANYGWYTTNESNAPVRAAVVQREHRVLAASDAAGRSSRVLRCSGAGAVFKGSCGR